jgi:hypothetical protein
LSLGLNSTRDLIAAGDIKDIRVGAKGKGMIVLVISIDAYLAKATGMAS